jgi:hypothetical protein
VHGRGGKSGLSYEVRIDSLPTDLQQAYLEQHPPKSIQNAPSEIDEFSELVAWRFEAIKDALKRRSRSVERADEIRMASDVIRTKLSGKHGKVSVRTLANWINAYEQFGMAGLKPKKRADKGTRRATISRQWDRVVNISDADKSEILSKLEKQIRSLWASLQPESGWQEVQRHASTNLRKLTLEFGPDIPLPILRKLCVVPRPLIERFREFKAVAVHDKDAKQYFDRVMPRVQRRTSNLSPMACVLGDVHPIDIYYRRDDGSDATPKGIFWMDAATSRLWCLPTFFEKGRGVTQKHVAKSFVGMAEDATWGIPHELYLDNGGEYNWAEFIKDAMALSVPIYSLDEGNRSSINNDTVIKSQPYNSPAKGQIEGVFRILEQKYFSKIPGWIGGDRTRKKITNVGKAPTPFPHSMDDLFNEILKVVELYNDTPRGGRLGGLSPNEKYEQFVSPGNWQPSFFEEGVLDSVLCKREVRTIRQGRIKYKGTWYFNDSLTNPALGDQVEIRIPLARNDQRILVFDQANNFVCIAMPDTYYDHGDRDGAIESTRRKRLARSHIRKMKSETDELDTLKLLDEEYREIRPVSVAEPGGIVSLTDDSARAGRELLKTPSQLTNEGSSAHDIQQEEWGKTMKKIMENRMRTNG